MAALGQRAHRCTAWASHTVMNTSTAGCRKRQASGDVSPQARPAITESTLPGGQRGPAPAGALQQAVGLLGLDHDEARARGPKRSQKWLTMPAASPPTPPCRITWVQGQGRVRRVLQQLVDHDPVALHHVARDFLVALVGGVGHHLPAVRRGQSRRLVAPTRRSCRQCARSWRRRRRSRARARR